MTLLHVHDGATVRRRPARTRTAPAWTRHVNWYRVLALGLNLALWAGIILGVRAWMHL